MRVINSYRQRLFVYYFSVFLIFGLILLVFQYSREKRYKANELEITLDQVSGITNSFIKSNKIFPGGDFKKLDSLHSLMPNPETRITVISHSGEVFYDSSVDDPATMENHLDRPEVKKALVNTTGANIRKSATTGLSYYYFARFYPEYYIRTAISYNMEIRTFLKAERTFWFVFLASFVMMWIILGFVTGKMGEAITKLKEFIIQLRQGEAIGEKITFPKNELGDIGREIIDIYNNLSSTRDELLLEKERLVSHLYALNEGVSIYSKDKKRIYHNNNFIQYAGMLTGKTIHTAEAVFDMQEFGKVNSFLAENLSLKPPAMLSDLPRLEYVLNRDGRYIRIQSVIFTDHSFEINLTDVTKPEKRRIFKQQMTSNIAHELKTPVSSILGFLETILESPEMDEKTHRHFLEKAYSHADRLSDLINEIVMLNRIEETGDHFEQEAININTLLEELEAWFNLMMTGREMKLIIEVEPGVVVRGNRSLLSSVFQNLLENAVKYAGEGSFVKISHYREDKEFHYFSLMDNGKGVEERHLDRLFERFYRVDEGRTRKEGGTGLGLAIVKNAILLHKGDISVRNVKGGGLEFLFTLPKCL